MKRAILSLGLLLSVSALLPVAGCNLPSRPSNLRYSDGTGVLRGLGHSRRDERALQEAVREDDFPTASDVGLDE